MNDVTELRGLKLGVLNMTKPKATRNAWDVPGHIPSTPYRIRIVRTPAQLDRAVQVRVNAYSQKLQSLADKVRKPGALDFEHDPTVLIAENIDTGNAIGTLRLNTGPDVLDLMSDIQLPIEVTSNRTAFVSRMAIVGSVREKIAVRNLIQKAVFQICVAKQVPKVLLLAVSPRERLFFPWGFEDVFADGKPRHPDFMDKFPVRALVSETYALERKWRATKSPLHEYVFGTFHPEIEVFSSLSSTSHRLSDQSTPSARNHPNRDAQGSQLGERTVAGRPSH